MVVAFARRAASTEPARARCTRRGSPSSGSAFGSRPWRPAFWHLQVCVGLGVGLGAACLGNVSNASLVARGSERV